MHVRLEVREATNGSAERSLARPSGLPRRPLKGKKSKRKRMSGLFDAKTDKKILVYAFESESPSCYKQNRRSLVLCV
jgi:hypothetical protein